MRAGKHCLKGLLAAATVVLMSACGQAGYAGVAAEASASLSSPEGAMLAYEHELSLTLAPALLDTRIDQLQASCQQGQFGDCAVLEVQRSGGQSGSGRLRMRLAPAAVEPMIQLASDGGELSWRRTHAEDLATAVADTQRSLDRLDKEHARLLSFQQRPDLAVADLLVLSQRLAEIESELGQARQQQAQQRRRIDTQLLTLSFVEAQTAFVGGAIGEALDDVGGLLTGSIGWMIRLAAVLFPVLVLVVAVLWGWRGYRRRR